MSDKMVKKRISLSLTQVYVDALDQLVEAGVYANRTEIITDGLRRIFRSFKMPPFASREPEKPED